MSSELEAHRSLIETCCRKNENNAEIERQLLAAGCQIQRERIRTWIIKETEEGRLPARSQSRRGRPPAKKTGFSPPNTVPESSPLAPGIAPTCAPATFDKTFDPAAFGQAFGLPIDQQGNLDLVAWGRQLGSERVQQLSDLELFFLESLHDPWRSHPQKWTPKWVESVKNCSQSRRQELVHVAEIEENIGRISLKMDS